ncbi:ThiF family adenylyltransferase [Cohnella luojiensis]|uniref:Thiamine biosynthesis protein ThiF n=1 Tax=Cohnella luojiensis TaxID=652876 RepID=A0A4Y8LZY2_9BACL|nr:ThiF family adenylyltransferase [Cohnella luojiensis]TFE28104.1 thiamine biosynthesis protein ThiF [Cohnella luojiensis]
MRNKTDGIERYSRQIRFAPIGISGQQRLGEASILVVGSGALGASLSQHMVRAGVGNIRLVDRDYVELSNLHRQTLFDEEDARSALPKSVAAVSKLRRMNGAVRMEALVADVNKRNVEALLMGVDLVLDGTDNTETRLLLSDACFTHGIPLIYGGVAGSGGMSAMFVPGDNCCLRCLLGEREPTEDQEAAPTCETLGVISPAVELVAALQAAEALKWLTGNRNALRRTWLTADVWEFSLKEWTLPPGRESCPFCGWSEMEDTTVVDRFDAQNGNLRLQAGLVPDYAPPSSEEGYPVVLCGRDTVQVTLNQAFALPEWKARLEACGCEITANNGYLLRASTPEGERIIVFQDGRALIQGAGEMDRAVEVCRLYLNDHERSHPIAPKTGF